MTAFENNVAADIHIMITEMDSASIDEKALAILFKRYPSVLWVWIWCTLHQLKLAEAMILLLCGLKATSSLYSSCTLLQWADTSRGSFTLWIDTCGAT